MSIKYCNHEADLVVVSSCAMSHVADIHVKQCFVTQPPLGADWGTTRGCFKHCQPNILIDINMYFCLKMALMATSHHNRIFGCSHLA
ncbi:hypothetical protein FKM82_031095 [Ascaphus truei]